MFGTSIHWTTFFYLLVDIVIVLFTLYQALRIKCSTLYRFLYLGLFYVAYNFTGGFLPTESFPGPKIIQYIITYSVAIGLCVYIVYYLYKEYDINLLEYRCSIKNLVIVTVGSFVILYLVPYFIFGSLKISKFLFTIPIALFALFFLTIFSAKIAHPKNPNPFILRRNRLSLISAASIALLPICTAIGDYQWLTFTIMNIGFYAITFIEIDRHLYFLENKARLYDSLIACSDKNRTPEKSPILYRNLTRRELEIALAIIDKISYKEIAKDLFITERTVSKHASNIFKKTEVKNRQEFINRFKRK